MTKPDKSFALSMSGGSAGCLSYVSFVDILKEQYQLKPSLYAGLSGGAIVAPFLAMGWNFQQVFEVISNLSLLGMLNFRPKHFELINHKKLIAFFREHLPVQTFEELPTPVLIFTSDVIKQETEVLDSGDLASAIVASCSVYPGLNPIKRLGKLLTDGGFSTYYGAQYIRTKGINTIVGIDVCGINEGTAPAFLKPFYRSLNTTLRLNSQYELEDHPVDVDIRLPVKAPLFFHLQKKKQYLYY